MAVAELVGLVGSYLLERSCHLEESYRFADHIVAA